MSLCLRESVLLLLGNSSGTGGVSDIFIVYSSFLFTIEGYFIEDKSSLGPPPTLKDIFKDESCIPTDDRPAGLD